MASSYTIGELARIAGVATSTVRYYERIGLLQPRGRSTGNYRLFDDESVRRLRFIRSAQAIGFTLDDVKVLLSIPASNAVSCRQVQTLIEARLEEIAQRLKDLRHVQRVLKTALAKCRKSERAQCCHVMDTLREIAEANSR